MTTVSHRESDHNTLAAISVTIKGPVSGKDMTRGRWWHEISIGRKADSIRPPGAFNTTAVPFPGGVQSQGDDAEPVHPPSAGIWERRQADDPQHFPLAICKTGGEQVSLQGLLARKSAILCRLLPARARAAPIRVKVALTVAFAHMCKFLKGLQAEADAAVQPEVLLGDLLLACGLVLICWFFLALVRIRRRI